MNFASLNRVWTPWLPTGRKPFSVSSGEGRKEMDTDMAPGFLRIGRGAEIYSRARLCPRIREDGKLVVGMHWWEMGVHLEAGRDVVNKSFSLVRVAKLDNCSETTITQG